MERYCPECNSTMTPSLAGYLCVNCGHMQRFYSAKEASLARPTPHVAMPAAVNPHKKHHKSTNKTQSKGNNKVKSTLKRLMVPELAPPHTHLIGDGDDNITPVLADKIEPELAPNSITSEATAPHAVPQKTIIEPDNTKNIQVTQESIAPNQSSNLSELESALHPQKNTSVWVMLALAALMLVVAAALLFLIILN